MVRQRFLSLIVQDFTFPVHWNFKIGFNRGQNLAGSRMSLDSVFVVKP